MAMPLETVIVVALVIYIGYTLFGATGFGASPITIPVLAHLLPWLSCSLWLRSSTSARGSR